jgi:hypothetical protein
MTNLEKIQSVLSEFNSEFISRHSKELSEDFRPDILNLWHEELEEYLKQVEDGVR